MTSVHSYFIPVFKDDTEELFQCQVTGDYYPISDLWIDDVFYFRKDLIDRYVEMTGIDKNNLIKENEN